MSEADWRAAEDLLRDALAALAPLRALPGNAPLADFVAAHRARRWARSRRATKGALAARRRAARR